MSSQQDVQGQWKTKIKYPKFFLQKPPGGVGAGNNASGNNPSSFNLNLKIEGNYKDSGTDEEQS